MLKGKTVNLSYGESKALERKYKRIVNKTPKSKKVKVSKVPMENDNGDKGSFFKYAYRFYYLLDMPADEAYRCFRMCMRGDDEGKVVAYLYDFGMKNRSELIDTVKRSTVEYREGIEEKFEFIKDKLKNNMFERLAK